MLAMTDAVLHRLQLPYPHAADRGPGWTDLWARPDTDDMDVIREVWVEDVYRVRGLDLAPHRDDAHPLLDTPGATVIDLGAHIGTFAALCLQYGAAKVICVEPNPENWSILVRNMTPFGSRAQVIHAAVAGSRGAYGVEGDGAASHVVPAGDYMSVSLSDTFRELAGNVALLKCDIEGAEYDVFEAIPVEQMRRIDLIHMETHGPETCPWVTEARIGDLVAKLLETHSVQTFGYPQRGGMIFAQRYEQ